MLVAPRYVAVLDDKGMMVTLDALHVVAIKDLPPVEGRDEAR